MLTSWILKILPLTKKIDNIKKKEDYILGSKSKQWEVNELLNNFPREHQ